MNTKAFLLVAFIAASLPALAQSTSVGDSSSVINSPAQNEPYGINAAQESGDQFSTRHYRFGQSTGIGGSTFQTTSPTTESMPSRRGYSPTSPALAPISPYSSIPNVPSFSERMIMSPQAETPHPFATIKGSLIRNQPPMINSDELDLNFGLLGKKKSGFIP